MATFNNPIDFKDLANYRKNSQILVKLVIQIAEDPEAAEKEFELQFLKDVRLDFLDKICLNDLMRLEFNRIKDIAAYYILKQLEYEIKHPELLQENKARYFEAPISKAGINASTLDNIYASIYDSPHFASASNAVLKEFAQELPVYIETVKAIQVAELKKSKPENAPNQELLEDSLSRLESLKKSMELDNNVANNLGSSLFACIGTFNEIHSDLNSSELSSANKFKLNHSKEGFFQKLAHKIKSYFSSLFSDSQLESPEIPAQKSFSNYAGRILFTEAKNQLKDIDPDLIESASKQFRKPSKTS